MSLVERYDNMQIRIACDKQFMFQLKKIQDV